MELKCSKCKKQLPVESFAKCTTPKHKSRGYRQYCCRACQSRYDKRRYSKTAPRVRKYQLLRFYGITPEQYQELYSQQSGLCFICLTPKDAWTGNTGTNNTACLYVDHDHKTNKVRGLLCHKCNFGLGQFKDDPELIKRALVYLQR